MIYVPPGRFSVWQRGQHRSAARVSSMPRRFTRCRPTGTTSAATRSRTGNGSSSSKTSHRRNAAGAARSRSTPKSPLVLTEIGLGSVGGLVQTPDNAGRTPPRTGPAAALRAPDKSVPSRTGPQFSRRRPCRMEDAIRVCRVARSHPARFRGARLCDEYEWERAARCGADAPPRSPAAAPLAADDANIDVTYGRDPLAFGPDEVGFTSSFA